MGAEVDERIYPGIGHTVIEDEIEVARAIVGGLVAEDRSARGGTA
jgi:hypothetical protein